KSHGVLLDRFQSRNPAQQHGCQLGGVLNGQVLNRTFGAKEDGMIVVLKVDRHIIVTVSGDGIHGWIVFALQLHDESLRFSASMIAQSASDDAAPDLFAVILSKSIMD